MYPLGQWLMTLPLWHMDAATGGGVHPISFLRMVVVPRITQNEDRCQFRRRVPIWILPIPSLHIASKRLAKALRTPPHCDQAPGSNGARSDAPPTECGEHAKGLQRHRILGSQVAPSQKLRRMPQSPNDARRPNAGYVFALVKTNTVTSRSTS